MGRAAAEAVRISEVDPPADTGRERRQGRHRLPGELVHPAAAPSGRAADPLSRRQPRVAVPVSRAVRRPRIDVPGRLTRHPQTPAPPPLRKVKAMSELKEPAPKTVKIPGPDHPIAIER